MKNRSLKRAVLATLGLMLGPGLWVVPGMADDGWIVLSDEAAGLRQRITYDQGPYDLCKAKRK